MQLNKKRILLWVYIVIVCGLLRGVFFIQHINSPLSLIQQVPAPLNQPLNALAQYRVSVESGTTYNHLINRLAAEGVVKYPFDIKVYGRITGQANNIKAGDYNLSEGMTPRDLLEKLVSGDVVEYQIVLVEGWTLTQALSTMHQHEMITGTLDANDESALQMLFETEYYPEGLIFPDTYNFSRGTTDLALVRRAKESMANILAEEWSARDVGLPYSSPYEALIMASIIEKETALASERQQIAGVFVRRLQQGMRLQTDPTVIYGLGNSFDGDLTRADLQAASPYNTYRNAGLPPTPIALPGRESIFASLHPDESDSLYFVARGDGSHYFSSTLAEHQQAVRQYQLGISE